MPNVYLNPVQTESGRSAQNNPINPIFVSVPVMPSTDIVNADPVPNLTEGQDFPSGSAGIEN